MIHKPSSSLLMAAASLGLLSSPAQAAAIAVLDSWPSANNVVDVTGNSLPGGTIYDLSTGGDTIGGITGTFSGVSYAFADTNSAITESWWNAAGDTHFHAGFTNGAGASGTWTFSNVPTNTTVEVFVNWRLGGQGNNTTTAEYVVNGSAAVTRNHTIPVPTDLTLNDPAGETNNFSLLGTYDSGALGQIVITASDPTNNGFAALDAAVIRFEPIPEPSTTAGLVLASLLLFARRRRL